jgi:hypothetical protein
MSCSLVYNRNKFYLGKEIQINQISTKGYYYSIYNRDINSGYLGKGLRVKVLLNNGFIHNLKNGYGDQCGYNINLDCEIKMSENMLNEYQNSTFKRANEKSSNIDLWNWGKYIISNDTIYLQHYYNRFGDYYLLEEQGRVLDSTSFILTKRIDYRTKKTETINEKYVFKKYDIVKMYDKVPKQSKMVQE